MIKSFFDLVEKYVDYHEVVEGCVAHLDKFANPEKALPIISRGHSDCSDFIFVDIGSSKMPSLQKIMVMHSSLNGLRHNEREALSNFLAFSTQVAVVPVRIPGQTTLSFVEHAKYLAKQEGYNLLATKPIILEGARQQGWDSLIMPDKPEEIITQRGGILSACRNVESHNFMDLIKAAQNKEIKSIRK